MCIKRAVLIIHCVLFSLSLISSDVITECLSNIQKHYGIYTLLAIQDNYDYPRLNDTSSMVVLNVNNKYNSLSNNKYKFQLFFINLIDSGNLGSIIDFLVKNFYYYPASKYVVVLPKLTNLTQIFDTLFKFYIINVVVLYQNDSNVYTYFPYDNSCGKNIAPVYTGNCLNSLNESRMYTNKVPLNLNGCGVRLLPHKIPPYVTNYAGDRGDPKISGLEVTIMHVVSERMNFTEKFISNSESFWGALLSNGTYTGLLKMLKNKEADILFGMVVAGESYDFDKTLFHLKDGTTWFVPSPGLIPHWQHLTRIFKREIWCIIIASVLLISLVWWRAGREKEKSAYYKSLTGSMLASLYVLTQGCLQQPKGWFSRALLLLWTCTGLLLFVAFQCQLISALTKTIHGKRITDMEELVSSGLNFGFFPSIASSFGDSKTEKYIVENFQHCPLSEECLNRTAFQKDFAVVKNRKQAYYLTSKMYTDSDGKPMIYALDGVVIPILPMYYVNRGYPLLDRINNLVLLLLSNGLIDKWERDVAYMNVKIKEEAIQQALTFGHLQGPFMLWIIGNSIAVFVFLFEIVYHVSQNRLMK